MWQILHGNNVDHLRQFPDNHFDSIVTDPPYGIDFLGKAWDANTGALETYQECLRVLKPGGHILAFSAARTYHHLAITLEQAGFEIRDQIMWIYSSGFPKSQDIGRQIQKSIYGKPDKQRFDPAIMIKLDGDKYQHPDSDKVYRKLPDINGDRLKKSHEGTGYGCVFEEVMNITKSAGYNLSGENKPVDTGVNGFRCYTCGKDSAARYDCKNNPCELHPPLEDDDAKTWSGWGTQLKPAHEPIVLARKPIRLSIAKNCQQWGVGALNIDATRIPTDDPMIGGVGNKNTYENFSAENTDKVYDDITIWQPADGGRFPSNVIGDIAEPYQKYFYCPKVSRAERHVGFDEIPDPLANYAQGDVKNHPLWDPSIGTNVQRLKHKILEHNKTLGQQHQVQGAVGNNHPTVKPIELMKYLIKLVTPAGGHVLDPFNGSGSTGCAAVELDYDYTGIELDPAYVAIAQRRIQAWYAHTHPLQATGLFE